MKIATLLVFALLWSVGAEGQEKSRLAILVEDLNEKAEACGITKSSIESIAALTLRNNGIQTSTERTNPRLYVRVTVLRLAAPVCTFSTEVWVQGMSASDFDRSSIGGFKPRKNSSTVLCSELGIVSSPQLGAARLFTENLETNIKLCLGNLEY